MEIEKIDSREIYEKHWNELNLHVLQSWEWGDVKCKKNSILRLGFRKEEKLAVLISVHEKSLLQNFIRYGYCPKANIPNQYFKETVDCLNKYIKTNTALDFILFDFNNKQNTLKFENLVQGGKNIQPKYTNIIDLTKEESELWEDVKKDKQHQKINRAVKLGVKIEIYNSGEDALNRFYEIIQNIYSRTKYVMYEKTYFDKIWNEFSKNSKAKIYLAKNDNQLLGSYLVLFDNLGAYELYGGANSLGRKYQAGHLLKWKAILDAKSAGKKYYDQWGVAKKLSNNEYDPSDELYYISKFKQGFGGEYIKFADQKALVLNDFKFQIYKFIQKLNFLKLKILKILK